MKVCESIKERLTRFNSRQSDIQHKTQFLFDEERKIGQAKLVELLQKQKDWRLQQIEIEFKEKMKQITEYYSLKFESHYQQLKETQNSQLSELQSYLKQNIPDALKQIDFIFKIGNSVDVKLNIEEFDQKLRQFEMIEQFIRDKDAFIQFTLAPIINRLKLDVNT